MSKKQDTNGTQMQSGSETAVSLNSDQSPIDKDDGTSGCAGCGCADCNESKPTGEFVNLVKEFTPDKSHVALTAATQAPSAAPGSPVPPQNTQPGGWIPTPPQQGVDVDTARQRIESRPLPTNIYVPASSQVPSGAVGLAAGFAGNTVAGPASIVELARSLKSNVDLIYEWIFNNIESLPSYGSQKGGLGAVIDGYGNSFDQADLMVQLLRQAGYTANYQFGTLRMTAAQAGAWLGTDPTNIWAANNYLANSGVPVSVVNISGVDGVEFSHCWVLCNIGGTNYVFDPSQKTYTTKNAINLATATSFNSSTFMTRAKTGATVTADYVQNLNRANIRSDLDTYSTNLVNWIKTNNHGAALDDILGGRNIVQNSAATPVRLTNHPFKKAGSTVTTWTSIPQAYKATLHVVYDTIDVTFNSHDLAGKRLTLFFNAGHQAQLRLDGVLIATSSAQGIGTWNSVLFDIVHPYPTAFADQYVWHRVWADKPYLLCQSFGNTSKGASQIHGRKQKANVAAGGSLGSESVLGEVMAAMWKKFDANCCRVSSIINRLTNCSRVFHHQCGLIGWFDTPLSDIGAISAGTSALDNNYNQQQTDDTTWAMHGVALEAQIFNEFAKIDGVSSTPMIDIANNAGLRIYDAKTANWLGTVKLALTGYPASDITNIENWYINNGYRVAIPSSGSLTRGSFTGYGYFAIPAYGSYGIIGGGLKGGSATCPLPVDAWTNAINWYYRNSLCAGTAIFDIYRPAPGPIGPSGYSGYTDFGYTTGGGSNYNSYTSEDPVDLTTGDSTLTQSDISVGSAPFPYGLGFTRSYNSNARLQDGVLGRGWSHGFSMGAQSGTDALMGLGDQSTLGAAASIAELFVAVVLQSDLTKPFDKYVVTVLANQWFSDNLIGNCVSISTGHSQATFVKLRDGTFTSSRGENGKIAISGGNYSYLPLNGGSLNFNADGQISSWVFPYGVTVAFNYTSGRLTSVTNGLGRTITLSYTGARLTSVSDGLGRSATFAVDGNGNLTSTTDVNGKIWSYQYDLPGRMIKSFMPANPSVAIMTNVYDSLDRVKTQADTDGNVYTFYFAGSRSEELNPALKSKIYYFTNSGQISKQIDELGNAWLMSYDGRNRVTSKTAPEGNKWLYTYNALDLVISTTQVAKVGSGLANISKSFTYDPIWFKTKTAVDGLSRTTTYSYDPTTGNLLNVSYPSVTGIGISQVSYTYNARGQVETTTDPSGIVTKAFYSPLSETLTQVISDFGIGRLNITTNFTYNSRGDRLTIQNPRGNTHTRQFDNNRRITQITAPSPFSYLTKFTYDDNGNLLKTEKQTSDPLNPWQTTSATYCPCGSIWSSTDPQGRVTTYEYDILHRLWKTTDAAGRVVERFYDDANRPSTIVDPLGVTGLSFTYSNNGQRLAFSDARGNSKTFTYDGFDRPLRTTYPDSTYEQINSYDNNNNVLVFRKRSGATVTFTYDEVNRVKTRAPSGQPVETTSYDISGRVTSVSTPVVPGDPSSGTISNFYDSAGRFYKETYPDGRSVIHVIDANANIIKTTYPDGVFFVDRVYDQLDRLTDIKLNGAMSSAVQFQYDALSRRKKTIFENSVVSDYGYELDDRLNVVTHTFAGSNVTFSYAFDVVGQMASHQISDGTNYSWHPPLSGTVTYGTANNIDQYPTVGGIAQSYNASGCQTSDGVWTYSYNTDDLLTSATKSGLAVSYLYDSIRRQRQKNVAGVKTKYYYAGWQRLSDYDGVTDALQQHYIYGTGLDDILIQISSSGTRTYSHANNQGSIIATTDNAGIVINRHKYGPFGESPSLVGSVHGYTGQRFDSDTGLYYYKTRYYSPKIGRFLQPDTADSSAGLNRYVYTGNAPLMAMDPLGMTAGDQFSSINEAIADWKKTYPLPWHDQDREAISQIYSVSCKGVKKFYYSAARFGGPANGRDVANSAYRPKGSILEGVIHHHGARDTLNPDDETRNAAMNMLHDFNFDVEEQFSSSDAGAASQIVKINPSASLYLVAGSGKVYRFAPLNDAALEHLGSANAAFELSKTGEFSYYMYGQVVTRYLKNSRVDVKLESGMKSAVPDNSAVCSKGYKVSG